MTGNDGSFEREDLSAVNDLIALDSSGSGEKLLLATGVVNEAAGGALKKKKGRPPGSKNKTKEKTKRTPARKTIKPPTHTRRIDEFIAGASSARKIGPEIRHRVVHSPTGAVTRWALQQARKYDDTEEDTEPLEDFPAFNCPEENEGEGDDEASLDEQDREVLSSLVKLAKGQEPPATPPKCETTPTKQGTTLDEQKFSNQTDQSRDANPDTRDGVLENMEDKTGEGMIDGNKGDAKLEEKLKGSDPVSMGGKRHESLYEASKHPITPEVKILTQRGLGDGEEDGKGQNEASEKRSDVGTQTWSATPVTDRSVRESLADLERRIFEKLELELCYVRKFIFESRKLQETIISEKEKAQRELSKAKEELQRKDMQWNSEAGKIRDKWVAEKETVAELRLQLQYTKRELFEAQKQMESDARNNNNTSHGENGLNPGYRTSSKEGPTPPRCEGRSGNPRATGNKLPQVPLNQRPVTDKSKFRHREERSQPTWVGNHETQTQRQNTRPAREGESSKSRTEGIYDRRGQEPRSFSRTNPPQDHRNQQPGGSTHQGQNREWNSAQENQEETYETQSPPLPQPLPEEQYDWELGERRKRRRNVRIKGLKVDFRYARFEINRFLSERLLMDPKITKVFRIGDDGWVATLESIDIKKVVMARKFMLKGTDVWIEDDWTPREQEVQDWIAAEVMDTWKGEARKGYMKLWTNDSLYVWNELAGFLEEQPFRD